VRGVEAKGDLPAGVWAEITGLDDGGGCEEEDRRERGNGMTTPLPLSPGFEVEERLT
jgi:hypothetical protein